MENWKKDSRKDVVMVDFAPYQILLVMGAIFVLLAIPFLLFYMKQEIFAPMTALWSL